MRSFAHDCATMISHDCHPFYRRLIVKGSALYSKHKVGPLRFWWVVRMVIVREIGDRQGEGIVLWNMSQALDQLGEIAQAIQYAEQALTIYEQIEDPTPRKCARSLPNGASRQTREIHFFTEREREPISYWKIELRTPAKRRPPFNNCSRMRSRCAPMYL